MSKIADDSESIAKRLKEIEAEKLQALTGVHIQHEATTGETLEYKIGEAAYGWPYAPSAVNEAARQYIAAQYQGGGNQLNQGYAGSLGGLSNNTLGCLGARNGASTLYQFNLPDLRGRVKASG